MEFWNKFVLVFLCICIISGVIFLPLHYLNNKVDYANKKIDEANVMVFSSFRKSFSVGNYLN